MGKSRGQAAVKKKGPDASLSAHALVTQEQARALEELFKVLANDTRIRLVHALLRSGELCVSDLAVHLGMTPQAVSNQLQRLAGRGIIESRREGNNIFYRVVDPCVSALLERGLCLAADMKQ